MRCRDGRRTAKSVCGGRCYPQDRWDSSTSENKFENGEVYEIDRVKYCCRAASTKVGGTGLRYTVLICGTETFLFDEENGKWFVEGKNRATL